MVMKNTIGKPAHVIGALRQLLLYDRPLCDWCGVIGVVLLVRCDWCGFGTCGVIDLLLIKYRQMASI